MLSIENAKPNTKMIKAVKKAEKSAKLVIIDTSEIINIQNIIPFARCLTGPALSVILTQSAPVDKAIPIGSSLKNPNKNAGITIPNVILRPSLKNLPLIKFI